MIWCLIGQVFCNNKVGRKVSDTKIERADVRGREIEKTKEKEEEEDQGQEGRKW